MGGKVIYSTYGGTEVKYAGAEYLILLIPFARHVMVGGRLGDLRP